ncbi:MAG: tetratricopeptide repeat protein [Cyanobacteria bacterium P01_H01_bin.58]
MRYSVKLLGLFTLATLTASAVQPSSLAQISLEDSDRSQLKQEQSSSEQSDFNQERLEEGDLVFSNTNRRFDAYRFEGEAGETIRMTVTSEAFVPVVSLVDETTGDVVRRETGEAGTAILTHELPRDGNYTFLVNATDVPGEGSYQFRIVTVREVPSAEIEAGRLLSEGQDLARQGQFEAAIQTYESALTLYQEVGDRSGELFTLMNLGLAHNNLGQYEQAIRFFEPALNLAREAATPEEQATQRKLEGDTLGGLALAYRELGQYEQAIALFREQIPILRELEDRFGEGRALGRLGIAYRESGQFEQAIEVLQQRIEIARAIGDRAGEGAGLGNLGLAYDGLGQYEQAIAAYGQRLIITRELGERDRESLTLGNLAETYVSLGQIEKAIELLQQSLRIAREINDSEQESRVLDRLEILSNRLDTQSAFTAINVEGRLDENGQRLLLGFDDDTPEARRLVSVHQFQGLAGQTLAIHVESEAFQPNLLLIDSEANALVARTDNSSYSREHAWLILTLPADGTYAVHVMGSEESDRGLYQFSLDLADAGALALAEATNLSRRALEQYNESAFQEALQLLEQALELYQRKTTQTTFPKVSRQQESITLGNIGNTYDALGEYELAIDFQNQSIALKRQLDERHSEAFSLNNLGNTYTRMYRYEDAIEAYNQALIINRETDNQLGKADSLERLGNIYIEQYKYEEAATFYEDLLDIGRTIKNSSIEVKALVGLGHTYKNLQEYDKAINFYQRVLVIARENNDRRQEIDALGYMGNVNRARGNFEAALDFLGQALEIAENSSDRQSQASLLETIGDIKTDIGNYFQAGERLRQALKISQEISDQSRESRILNSLGILYQALGQEEKAREAYKRSLEISLENNNLRGEALAASNLAGSFGTDIGLLLREDGFALNNRSAEIAAEINDKNLQAESWLRLGRLYVHSGYGGSLDFVDGKPVLTLDIDEGLNSYLKALNLYREINNKQREGITLRAIGEMYSLIGLYQEAIDYYEESLSIFREIGNRASEAESLMNLASAHRDLGSYVDADSSAREALAILDDLREVELNDTDKVALFEAQRNAYATLQQILLAQGKVEDALVASERARARVIVETLATRVSTQSDQEVLDTVPDITEIRSIVQQQNATLVSYTLFGTSLQVWVVQPTGEIIFRSIEFAPNRTSSELIETETGEPISRELPFQSVRPTDFITNVRQAISVRGSRSAGAPPQLRPEILAQLQAEQDEKLRQLHDLLIEPIADLLPNDPNQSVVFIPQNELFLVPFPALKDDSGDYLIENHTILTAPSIQVLQLTHDIADSREGATTGKPLIVGNPTMPTVTFLSEAGNFEDVQLSSLFGAQQEAQAVAEFLEAPALIGTDATEATVKQQLASADLIHLATHGLLEYGDPRETGTRDVPGAIALAPGSGEDGLLTSAEILQMDLQADLVVLSACDTGRGRITGDGVVGLSRSFIAAGVPSVVVSLWAVPDAPTADLMTEFYRQLDQGQTKAQALRQAMLMTMQDHPDPKDWAAFTLIGESE